MYTKKTVASLLLSLFFLRNACVHAVTYRVWSGYNSSACDGEWTSMYGVTVDSTACRRSILESRYTREECLSSGQLIKIGYSDSQCTLELGRSNVTQPGCLAHEKVDGLFYKGSCGQGQGQDSSVSDELLLNSYRDESDTCEGEPHSWTAMRRNGAGACVADWSSGGTSGATFECESDGGDIRYRRYRDTTCSRETSARVFWRECKSITTLENRRDHVAGDNPCLVTTTQSTSGSPPSHVGATAAAAAAAAAAVVVVVGMTM